MLLAYPILIVLVIATVWFSMRLWKALVAFQITMQGPFYCPVSEERLETVMELAEVKKGIKAVDLGSGDGRILIALAKAGARATGYEIDPELIAQSRKNITKARVESRAEVRSTSFWDADLSHYDLVTIYCTQRFMPRLTKKLERELKPGAKVISVYFTLVGWKPKVTKNEIHLYIKT